MAKRSVNLKRLLALAKPEAGTLIAGTVALLVSSLTTLLTPQILGYLVNGLGEEMPGGSFEVPAILQPLLSGQDLVREAVIALLVLMTVGAIAGGIRAWLFTVAGERIVAELRKALYRGVIHQEIGFFDERRTGELTNRLASDTTVLQNTVSVNISMLLRFVVLAAGAIVFLFYTSWQLTLGTLAVVPAVAIGAGLVGRRLRGLSTEVQDALAESTTVAEETFSGIRTVRAFAREGAESERYSTAVERSFQLARKRALVIAVFRAGMSMGAVAGLVLVLWYGSNLLMDGKIDGGQLASYAFYTMMAGVSFGALSGLYEDFMKAMGASERVFQLLDREPVVVSGADRLAAVRGELVFEDVTFAYPSRDDLNVLSGLSLEMNPGQVVALVGHSGSGKSTVAALLSRFYDPQGGRVLLDGHPYAELDKDWLRAQVGVVSQEPILFATSVIENIRYGRPDATLEQVQAAAQAANAHEFIEAFPEGYGTLVGERGVKLSGGQKQRVAIARALLKDPRVLVLDEATSALDAESEHLVQEALDRLMQGRTTLVIAHRLSTVKEADRVLVLDGGKVVQAGSHDELVGQDGLYRRLVERQFAAA
jgi:ATP-binding cassette subfamily B protein